MEPIDYWELGLVEAMCYDACNPPTKDDSESQEYVRGYGDGMEINLKTHYSVESIALESVIKRIDWEYAKAKENWLNED